MFRFFECEHRLFRQHGERRTNHSVTSWPAGYSFEFNTTSVTKLIMFGQENAA